MTPGGALHRQLIGQGSYDGFGILDVGVGVDVVTVVGVAVVVTDGSEVIIVENDDVTL